MKKIIPFDVGVIKAVTAGNTISVVENVTNKVSKYTQVLLKISQ